MLNKELLAVVRKYGFDIEIEAASGIKSAEFDKCNSLDDFSSQFRNQFGCSLKGSSGSNKVVDKDNLISGVDRTFMKNSEDIESLLENIKSTLEGLLDDSDEVNID